MGLRQLVKSRGSEGHRIELPNEVWHPTNGQVTQRPILAAFIEQIS